MKQYINIFLAATALTTVSCSDSNFDEILSGGEKEVISFSMSDEAGSPTSRAASRAGFEANTQIIARLESFKSASIGTAPATGADKVTTRMVLTAQPHNSHDNKYSDVTTSEPRYWDDCFGRYANLSVYAVAVPGKADVTNGSTTLINLIDYSGDQVNSTLWKKDNSTPSNNNITWEVTKGELNAGTSIKGQDETSLANEDLCYSNNIQTDGTKGVYRWNYDATPGYPAFSEDFSTLTDGVMRFAINSSDETAPGHFDKGHMNFKHALTRLTIHLKRGTGFAAGSGYFKFKKEGSDDTNIKIIGVPTKNTLDIKAGTWGSATTGTIEKMAPATSKVGYDYSLMAQFIPGYAFNKTNNTNVLEFTIDDNTYYITQENIWKALNDNRSENGLTDADTYTMEQGKNYILDITVNKTAIANITATLVGWGEVLAANIDAENSYITISSQTMNGNTLNACNHFDIFRADASYSGIYADQSGTSVPTLTNWGGNYTQKAGTNLSETTSSGIWNTGWHWDSNKSFYHFRTVDKGITLNETETATDDYFNVYSGPVNETWSSGTVVSTAVNDKNYNDYHWGAPMKKDATLTYSITDGYTSSLYPAIGSTKDQINIIEQHMMSTVHFILHTGTKSDNTPVTGGAVSLMSSTSPNNGTRLTLTNFYGQGQVKMGNGFITTDGSLIDSDIPVPGAAITYGTGDIINKLTTLETTSSDYFTTANTVTKSYDYRVVPQLLYRGSASDPKTDNTLSNFIGLTIVTPDNNQYYVIQKLYGVNGTISNNGSKTEHGSGTQPITRWYPGYDYTYHIYINKTGIEKITCTVVDWAKVEGTIGDINLED